MVGVVNQLFGDFLITGAEFENFLPWCSNRQTCGSDMRGTIINAIEQITERIRHDNGQFDTKLVGKHFYQVVFQPGRPIRALVVGSRAVSSQHPEFAAGQYFVQCGFLQKFRQPIEKKNNNADD